MFTYLADEEFDELCFDFGIELDDVVCSIFFLYCIKSDFECMAYTIFHNFF